MATNPGMMDYKLRNSETGEEVEYETTNLQIAQHLATEDHGGEPEDWQDVDTIED